METGHQKGYGASVLGGSQDLKILTTEQQGLKSGLSQL